MTVLYILHTTDAFGGATKSFLTLLKGVLKYEHKAIVVVPDRNGIYNTLKDMGVEVIVVYSKGCTWTSAWNFRQVIFYVPRQIGRMIIDYKACLNLRKLLTGKTIDLVHSNSTVTYLGRYISKKFHLPHLYHIREYGNKDFGLTYFPTNISFYKHLKTTGVYSACITKDIQKHFGLEHHSSSKTIYNGILDNVEPCVCIPMQRQFFLYAGRIEQTKGLLDLIEAYSEYVNRVKSPLLLKVAGEVLDLSYIRHINAFIENHNLKQMVVFLGKVKNMSDLYGNAKATVIPSHFEGFGRCMPEAMSCGSVVIGRNTGGTKEQFDNGQELMGKEIGIRFYNNIELTDALVRVHNMQKDEIEQLTQLARKCVSTLYSTEKYVTSVLDFYNEILSK